MIKKFVLSIVVLFVLAVSGLAGFVFLARPLSRAPLNVTANATPERLARGEYLANTTACLDCHSKRDWTRYSGPPLKPLGAHGEGFDKGVGVPGVVYPPNLTSDKETGLGSWTDGEILRAMREGVSRDGRPLFPSMPYGAFKTLSDEDALSIVAFLRTLPAETYKAPAPQLAMPLPIVIRFIPQPLTGPVTAPARTDTMAYGEYLSNTMGCTFCHTPVNERMAALPGRDFAGGHEMTGPWGVVRSANLTPHETGMADKTKENFIGLFRAFGDVQGTVAPGGQNTVMPWSLYNKLTDEDLGIVYEYLKAQKPVKNIVEKFPKTPRA